MKTPKVVLITGCSSGIGAALAQEFHARGHQVFATARRVESMRALQLRGLQTLALDVNEGAGMAMALAAVQNQTDHLDILINNAGYGQFGAVLDTQIKDLRRQFETNVFAPVALSRAALPLLRKSKSACIVNMGSISGIVTTPFAGVYCASKAALHSLSEALRIELAPFGVRVVMIQPGGIASRFGATGEANVKLPPGSLYAPIERFVLGRAKASQRGATPVEEFARTVVEQLLQTKPPAVLRTGAQSTRLPMLKRWLPEGVLDRKLQKLFGLDQL
jgi:NAD(P)-dependent dehydrogenase (short-subunit alcohol dehydrogenase family)